MLATVSQVRSSVSKLYDSIVLFNSEPHRHHGKEKETHEGFSLWLSWLAVLLVGAYARRRRRRSRATWRPYSSKLADRDMYPWILAEECRLFLAGFLKKKKIS